MPCENTLEERASIDTINQQAVLVNNQETIAAIINADPSIVMVLNQHRQIVFANQALLDFLHLKDFSCVFGMRPGEALKCEHASELPEGCGTTEFCQTCGALNAILTSHTGDSDIQDCRIIQQETGDALDLRVWTTPLVVTGEPFTIFALQDISNEKRRIMLERVFFHDILNTAGNLRNYAVLLKKARPDEIEEFSEDLRRLSEGLIDEIQSHREISRAENGELVVDPILFKPGEVVEETAAMYYRHETASSKKIKVQIDNPEISIISDPTLLKRILGNMIKNALEASQAGDTITLGFKSEDENVTFWVHNPAVMSTLVRLQVFQRSFSTKGAGRGLGTYSIKLLGERYLGGKVTFRSDDTIGTEFRLVLPYKRRTEKPLA